MTVSSPAPGETPSQVSSGELSWAWPGRNTANERNASILGQLHVYYADRTIVMPMDSDAALRTVAGWRYASSGRWEDPIDPVTAPGAVAWAALSLDDVLALVWIPGRHTGDGAAHPGHGRASTSPLHRRSHLRRRRRQSRRPRALPVGRGVPAAGGGLRVLLRRQRRPRRRHHLLAQRRRPPPRALYAEGKAAVPGHETTVALPTDLHQVDETGHVWAVLEEAYHPERVQPGRLVVAGDANEPFTAHVIDIVPGGAEGTHSVHLDLEARTDN